MQRKLVLVPYAVCHAGPETGRDCPKAPPPSPGVGLREDKATAAVVVMNRALADVSASEKKSGST